jgi:hypothetical protein
MGSRGWHDDTCINHKRTSTGDAQPDLRAWSLEWWPPTDAQWDDATCVDACESVIAINFLEFCALCQPWFAHTELSSETRISNLIKQH